MIDDRHLMWNSYWHDLQRCFWLVVENLKQLAIDLALDDVVERL